MSPHLWRLIRRLDEIDMGSVETSAAGWCGHRFVREAADCGSGMRSVVDQSQTTIQWLTSATVSDRSQIVARRKRCSRLTWSESGVIVARGTLSVGGTKLKDDPSAIVDKIGVLNPQSSTSLPSAGEPSPQSVSWPWILSPRPVGSRLNHSETRVMQPTLAKLPLSDGCGC